jgi:hypothetical protein
MQKKLFKLNLELVIVYLHEVRPKGAVKTCLSFLLLACLFGCATQSSEPTKSSNATCSKAADDYHHKYQSFLSSYSNRCKSDNDCFLWFHETHACDLGKAFSHSLKQTDSFKELQQLRATMVNHCEDFISHTCEAVSYNKAVCKANICEAAIE